MPRQVACLTNGRYSVQLSARGGGHSDWRGLAVTRWSADETCDAEGFHVYLRDLDEHFVWSAGYQPTRVATADYEFSTNGSVAEIRRTNHAIECRLSVCVPGEYDCELRRCRLVNRGQRTRRIELTSYLEWVLAGRESDANHPAFSKLFIETQYCAEHHAILARRRPRSSEDGVTWGFHSLLSDDLVESRSAVEFETNRAAFIGRGRTLRHPHALDATCSLAGHTGPVLDPIGSLRLALSLEPGEMGEVAFLLGAAQSREEVEAMLAAFGTLADVNEMLDRAAADSSRNGELSSTARPEELDRTAARIIVHPPHRSLRANTGDPQSDPLFEPSSAPAVLDEARPIPLSEPLEFDNGYGGFSADGREYVIRIEADRGGEHRRPPMPWVNVIANESAGFLVTESGAGYTWAGNSRLNRLTAWHNDPICDPHSEAMWIRDEEAGVFWSPMPGPTPAPADYIVRHGFGYTTFEHESHQLGQRTTMFMAREDPVKIVSVRLVNRSSRPRRLSLFSYAHWALGGLACETSGFVSTAYDEELRAILATNASREQYGERVAFSAVGAGDSLQGTELGRTCDRASFLGDAGDITAPAALIFSGELDARAGGGLDPCAAWRVPIELPAGGACDCMLLLGEAPDRIAAAELIQKYRVASVAEGELRAVSAFWQNTVSSIQIETPDREIDLMVNGWLTYQNLSCRMWGRSAYYQPGGAFGFRDQLQDAAALLYLRPDSTRAQIIRHASQQFLEGDVLHWWHPDTGYGLRTRFSDDLLWLPYVTACYVMATGDKAILDEDAPFVVGPELTAGEAEAYLCPAPSGVEGSIYEHCCRALDRGLTTGLHGLPLIGCGDWNDGFSRVGQLGRGESVWLGFFIHYVLGQMLPICAERGDAERVSRYTAYRERLAEALNSAGWDGAWYRRAYYDNGQPLGSAQSDECQIDALAQAWAVLSGVAPAERARTAMGCVEERLVCRDAGMIRLLAPAFDRTPQDPGYIRGYLPGIRENGGQYTHGVLWVVRAFAEMGHGTKAVELLRMLSPVWHTACAERTDVYQTEPYVLAADVYGEPPHVGRGGWTWYTGSAGWMFRVTVESIFGLSIEHGRTLLVKPAISSSWPRCRLTYRLPGESTRYEITIENPSGKETTVTSATLDGTETEVDNGAARIPIQHDGGVHRVVVWL